MAPKNKRTNKRKKKGNRRNAAPATPLPAPARDRRQAPAVPESFPAWPEANAEDDMFPLRSIYAVYKEVATRVRNRIREMCPEIDFASDRVQVLVEAADAIVSKNTTVPKRLVHDLRLTIRLRTRVAEFYDKRRDAGHSYFISVLMYCWTVLRPLSQGVPEDL